MTCTAHLPAAAQTAAELTCTATLRARFPACDGACEAGRSHCGCPLGHPAAEACTDSGADPADDDAAAPLHGLATLADRWPRAFTAATVTALVALLSLASQLDAPPAPEPTADAIPPHFAEAPAGDGLPPELLAEARP